MGRQSSEEQDCCDLLADSRRRSSADGMAREGLIGSWRTLGRDERAMEKDQGGIELTV